VVCVPFSIFMSHYTYRTDFPHFYYAASTIVDQSTPNTEVYNIDKANKYSIPEEAAGTYHVFIYSIPVAYLIAPLALMPYFMAKAVWISLNILFYIAAVIIILNLSEASGRWFTYPLMISCLWAPFVENIRYGQGNGIPLFLVTVAILAATKNRSTFSGILLSIATLFKLFPIAVAMVFGIKNWRVIVSFAVVFSASFLTPGSLKWFFGIKNSSPDCFTPTFLWLNQFGSLWFVVYAATIAGITALMVHRTKNVNYPFMATISIPAVFLAMPILEYHHLTLLIFSYVHLLFSSSSNRLLTACVLLSFIMINLSFILIKICLPLLPFFSSMGLFLLWSALIWRFLLFDIKQHG